MESTYLLVGPAIAITRTRWLEGRDATMEAMSASFCSCTKCYNFIWMQCVTACLAELSSKHEIKLGATEWQELIE